MNRIFYGAAVAAAAVIRTRDDGRNNGNMRQANARAAAFRLDISSCRVHSKDVIPSAVSSIDPIPANITNKPNYMLVTTHIRRQFHLVHHD